ncbi:hypothetical protein HDV03_001178 [Kappamyces sp. JEL0829]|nr:hypothetical protein HDV03_001178 [Kappamyces sp. JEL0829]
MSAQQVLLKQYKELSTHPVPGFTISLKDDDIFEWRVGIIGPPDTIYQSGYFLATLKFPTDYPFSPPSFVFNSEFFHPNIYPDGRLCISILHPPGDDPMSGEKASERWNPTQTVESILLSVVSLLNDPNTSSPANVDAGVLYRNDREAYEAIVKQQVERSKRDIPPDLVIPVSSDAYAFKPKTQELTPEDDSAFWCAQTAAYFRYDDDEMDGSIDFGGSDEDDENDD